MKKHTKIFKNKLNFTFLVVVSLIFTGCKSAFLEKDIHHIGFKVDDRIVDPRNALEEFEHGKEIKIYSYILVKGNPVNDGEEIIYRGKNMSIMNKYKKGSLVNSNLATKNP